MASQTFSELDIRTLLCDGAQYFCAKDVCKSLGYTNPRQAIRVHLSLANVFLLEDLKLSQVGNRVCPHTRYLNEAGVRELLAKSQQPNAYEIGNKIGVKIESRYMRKELEILKHLIDFLSELAVATEFQKTVGRYRVDLYLPDYNLALEIDEHGHSDRDPEYEAL